VWHTCKGPYACTHATIGFSRWQRGPYHEFCQKRSAERKERGGRTVPSQPRNMQLPSISPKTGEICCPARLSKTFNNHVRRRLSVLRGDIRGNHMATRKSTPASEETKNSPFSVLPPWAGVPMLTSGNCKWERASQNTGSEQVDCQAPRTTAARSRARIRGPGRKGNC
jgi:hypothetical protein